MAEFLLGEQADIQNDGPQETTEVEDESRLEEETDDESLLGEEETDDESLLGDEETEDDLRRKALFAQMDGVIAQNKSVPTYAEMRALNDAFLKKLDEKYPQRFAKLEEEA